MTDDVIKHVGVMGMHWGQRKGSSSNVERSNARISAIKLVNQRDALRKQRSFGTKVGDWVLTSHFSNKLHSEEHGSGKIAKKGAELSNQIAELRKKRSTGVKIVDALMTPYKSSRKFSEMEPRKRRAVTALTAAIMVGGIGAMKANMI